MRIKKNDFVVILSGKERGQTGRVKAVLPKENRVVVEGRNVVHRHVRQGPQGQEGGIIPREAAIDASNVALYSEKASGPVRVRTRFQGKGGQLFPTRQKALSSFGEDTPERIAKVRFAPKTNEIFD